VAERAQRLQVASRPAAQVQNRERRRAFQVPQQLADVLADVVIARAAPELLRPLLVVLERALTAQPAACA